MSNVLHPTTQQQLLALGRLGWSLRRIEQATQVRRETASAYLKAAGIPVRGRGGRPAVWSERSERTASPKEKGRASTRPLPLLGSNQDSTDPEGPCNPLISQQLAVLTARSCTRSLGFAGFDAGFARVCSLKWT
jgi:hypothetical protein